MADHCACCATPKADAAVLDVRELVPPLRPAKIVGTFDGLGVGERLVLVTDHDPETLLSQFRHERPGGAGWRYLEQGPETWRVELTRQPPPIGAEQTVGEVARRHPRAAEAMKRLGVNHCCGAHLTLAEAAAAAGVALPDLLAAVQAARGEAP